MIAPSYFLGGSDNLQLIGCLACIFLVLFIQAILFYKLSKFLGKRGAYETKNQK